MDLQKVYGLLQNRDRSILGFENFSKYSVLLPIVEKNGESHLLFEVRSLKLRRQPGEICFPGGRIDKTDKNEQFTAIRETTEELGIEPAKIENVAPLDFLVNPFGTIVYPFVGTLSKDVEINPNKAEVEEVFAVPLSYLMETKPDIYHIRFNLEPEKGFPFDKIPGGENYNWQERKMEEHFYYYEDKVIWGLTARILTHFLDIIKKK